MARLIKHVSFNIETEKDIMDLANSLPNFSKWVKDMLKEKIITEKVLKQTIDQGREENKHAEPLITLSSSLTKGLVKNEEINANDFL